MITRSPVASMRAGLWDKAPCWWTRFADFHHCKMSACFCKKAVQFFLFIFPSTSRFHDIFPFPNDWIPGTVARSSIPSFGFVCIAEFAVCRKTKCHRPRRLWLLRTGLVRYRRRNRYLPSTIITSFSSNPRMWNTTKRNSREFWGKLISELFQFYSSRIWCNIWTKIRSILQVYMDWRRGHISLDRIIHGWVNCCTPLKFGTSAKNSVF